MLRRVCPTLKLGNVADARRSQNHATIASATAPAAKECQLAELAAPQSAAMMPAAMTTVDGSVAACGAAAARVRARDVSVADCQKMPAPTPMQVNKIACAVANHGNTETKV